MLCLDQLKTPFMAEMCEMGDRITQGERYPHWLEPTDGLTPEYKERITYWLRRAGLTEATGGPAFFNMIPLVPYAEAAEHLCHIAAEELSHGRMYLELLRDFGYDSDEIFQSRWTMTAEEEWAQLGFRQAGRNLHETTGVSTAGFETVIAFTMLIDPMGLLVVCERMRSNYGPWVRANAKVLQDEKGHAAFWERYGMDFIQSEQGHPKVQRAIDEMFATTLGAFGRPAKDDPMFAGDKALGIRTADPDEYREILKEMLRPTFETLGFEMPRLEPVYTSLMW